MSYSKNLTQSPAQTQNERKPLTTMDRVRAGETFRVHGDKMGFSYRFEKIDSISYMLLMNSLMVGVCNAGSFYHFGFCMYIRLLGQCEIFTVNASDITFDADVLHFDGEGGAVC